MATSASTDVFNPDIWNSELNHELNKSLIFDKWTERKYEKDLKEAGDQVRIFAIGQVSVESLDWSKEEDRVKFENDLGDPKKTTGSAITLVVNQIAYYQLAQNDIEKKLRDKDTWTAYKEDCVTQIKDQIDQYVANFAKDFPYYKKETTTVTVNNVLKTLSTLRTKLNKQNVSPSAQLKMEVPFEFLQVLEEAYENFRTSNEDLMKNGCITSDDSGIYHKMIFEATNNCCQDEDGTYHLMLRTKRSLAFVNRVTFSEIIRSGKGFQDILRGYCLYDAKVVRPKEGITLKCKVDDTESKYVLTKTQA